MASEILILCFDQAGKYTALLQGLVGSLGRVQQFAALDSLTQEFPTNQTPLVVLCIRAGGASVEQQIERLQGVEQLLQYPLMIITPQGLPLFTTRLGRTEFWTESLGMECLKAKIHDMLSGIQLANQLTATKVRLAKSEQALLKTERSLQRSNELKKSFLSNISHEFRTPLNGLMGMAEMLSYTDLNEEQYDLLSKVYEAGETLKNLITDVVEYSQIDANQLVLKVDQFSLETTIQRVITEYQSKIQKKGLTFDFIAEIVPNRVYLGDPQRIQQILEQMLDNALKFTEKGHIELKASIQETLEHQDTLLIQCVDSGIGIMESHFETIFDKFNQVDVSTTRKYQGKGLGLTICLALAHLMGGNLTVASELGQGSTFSFSVTLKKSLLDKRTKRSNLH